MAMTVNINLSKDVESHSTVEELKKRLLSYVMASSLCKKWSSLCDKQYVGSTWPEGGWISNRGV